MAVVTCTGCGGQYLDTARVCPDCNRPLGGGPLEEGDDQVGYDLDDWSPDQKGELIEALASGGIAHRWEESELIVHERDADVVEQLIDDIDHPDALDAEADPGDDLAATLLSTLYVAADVLANDHDNPAAILDLIDAEEVAAGAEAPYGVDAKQWESILDATGTLAALLDAQAPEDDVCKAAKVLRDLLHPLV
jgi:hypothetical protein